MKFIIKFLLLKMKTLFCFYNGRHRGAILLLVSCFVVTCFGKNTLSADNPNELTRKAAFSKFVEAVQKQEKCSKALKEFCDTAGVGVIHTFSHYKTIGRVKQVEKSQEPLEIARARKLLRGLSEIALKAVHDEFDAKERLAILEQLVRLEESILKEKPLGAGNVTLANAVSTLISGLIFQEVAESDISGLDKIAALIQQRRDLDKYYTNEAFEEILKRELGYSPATKPASRYELLMSDIKEKYPVLVEKYEKRKHMNIAHLYAELSLLSSSNSIKDKRSSNPLVETDIARFTSEVFVVRELEIFARMSPVYRQLREKYKLSEDRLKFASELSQAFIHNTNAFEKDILGNDLTERGTGMMDAYRRIQDNLSNRGKTILLSVYQWNLFLSENLDIVKE